MSRFTYILKDRRYLIFYAFAAIIIAILSALEEVIENDYESYQSVLFELIVNVPVFFLVTLFIGYLSNLIIDWLNDRYSWEQKNLRRLVYEVVIVLVIVTILTIITSVASMMFSDDDGSDRDTRFVVLTMLLFYIVVTMVFAFHEYISLNEDKDEYQHIAKDLERQNYISRYEALKNQVNPHFLFNSLNVLSSLIYSDISLSDKFIRKFSEVFRYVLELNNQELVTLKREIEFINSYFFLQKIRHEEAISLSIRISSEDLDKLIPPMALQIIVENAFKHNMISNLSPLRVELYTCNHKLIIRNNYQARSDSVSSTGIGQKNLMDRYKLQTDELPDFYIEDEHYVVELPLLNQA